MILDFCSFTDLGRMAATCSQFNKHVDSDNMSQTWEDIAIDLTDKAFGAECVQDIEEIKNFEKSTSWKELSRRVRMCEFIGRPSEGGNDDEEVFIAEHIIVDVGSTEIRIGADIHDYVCPLRVPCNRDDSYESKIEKALNQLMGSGMWLRDCTWCWSVLFEDITLSIYDSHRSLISHKKKNRTNALDFDEN